jgi:hypothetical protein
LNIPLPQLGIGKNSVKVIIIPLPKDFKGEDCIILNERKEEDRRSIAIP